jgi:hypothetical protein
MSNEIPDILVALNKVNGVVGSAVLTNDGMVVASLLGQGFLDDVVAGLSSFLISTTRRSLQEAGMGQFNRFVLNATHGKVVLVDIGAAFLIVLTSQFASLKHCIDAIGESAAALRRVSKIEA